jgi:hypothetical protein
MLKIQLASVKVAMLNPKQSPFEVEEGEVAGLKQNSLLIAYAGDTARQATVGNHGGRPLRDMLYLSAQSGGFPSPKGDCEAIVIFLWLCMVRLRDFTLTGARTRDLVMTSE